MGYAYAELIADPVADSPAPLIHRFWLEKLQLREEYRALRVTPAELPAYLDARRADLRWRGCNVASPNEVRIGAYLDALFDAAQASGAVNLVMNVEGRLAGANTDVRGFAEPFRVAGPERGFAAVIGTGSAARTALVALDALGFTVVHVASPTPARAQAMLRSFGRPDSLARPLEERLPPVDLLVNAAAPNEAGGDFGIDLSPLPPTAAVYDMHYQPGETPLLKDARQRGLRTIDGLALRVGEAAASFVHLFGAAPPREHDAELREMLTR